jgi:hypothetical protein
MCRESKIKPVRLSKRMCKRKLLETHKLAGGSGWSPSAEIADAGAIAVLAKPVRLERLEELLNSVEGQPIYHYGSGTRKILPNFSTGSVERPSKEALADRVAKRNVYAAQSEAIRSSVAQW